VNTNFNNSKLAGEREISLRELLWKIVYGWRLVIIIAIIFSVVVTGIKYYKDTVNLSIAKKAKSKTEEELLKELTSEETEELLQAQNIQKQIEEKKEYQTNSILSNLNPYQMNMVTLQYSIRLNSEDNNVGSMEDIVSSYKTYIDNNGIIKDIKEKSNWSLDDAYLGELITTTEDIKNTDIENDMNDRENSIFVICVIGENNEKAEELADAVDVAMKNYSTKISTSMGSHELILLDRYIRQITDQNLAVTQSNLQTSITNLQTQFNSLTEKFNTQQTQILEGIKDDTVIVEKVSVNGKYTILGFLLGVFAACVLLVLKYIYDNTVKSEEELKEIYGLRVFGNITIKIVKKRRMFSGVDVWLESKEHRTNGTLEEQMEGLVINLSLQAKNQNIKNVVMIAPSALKEQEKEILSSVNLQLKEKGLEILLKEDMTQNINIIEDVADFGNVVFVVKGNSTKYKELEKDLERCSEQNANILGTVFFA